MPQINLEFLGTESVTIDGNGRFKLTSGFLRDFQRHTDGDVVLLSLPEGAIGIFPPAVWDQIGQRNLIDLSKYDQDLAYRRQMRRFGSKSAVTQISGQGRITLPNSCRIHAGLEPPCQAVLLGNRVGVEVWHPDRLAAEDESMEQHLRTKGDRSMKADLGGESGTTITIGTTRSGEG